MRCAEPCPGWTTVRNVTSAPITFLTALLWFHPSDPLFADFCNALAAVQPG